MKIEAAHRLHADEDFKRPTSWLWTSDGMKGKQLKAVAQSVYELTKDAQIKKWAAAIVHNELMPRESFTTIVKALCREFKVVAKDNATDLQSYLKDMK
jgi:hypothetical protein